MSTREAQVFFTLATNKGLPNTFFLFNQIDGIDSTTQISELKFSRDLFISFFLKEFKPSIERVKKEEFCYNVIFKTKDGDLGTLTIAEQGEIFGSNQTHQKIKIKIISRRTNLGYPKIIEFYWEGVLINGQVPSVAISSFSIVPTTNVYGIVDGMYLYEGNKYTGVNTCQYDKDSLPGASFVYNMTDDLWNIQVPYDHPSAGSYGISGLDISLNLRRLGIFPSHQLTKEFIDTEMVRDASLFFTDPNVYMGNIKKRITHSH